MSRTSTDDPKRSRRPEWLVELRGFKPRCSWRCRPHRGLLSSKRALWLAGGRNGSARRVRPVRSLKTTTFVAASWRPTAPCMFGGPINGEKFRAYVEPILPPTHAAGDLEVMDNLASHETASISARPLRASALSEASCRPTAPISSPSNWCSPRSKTSREKWDDGPIASGMRPASPSTTSHPQTASTNSATPAMDAPERNPL
jgi:hypothetical protein